MSDPANISEAAEPPVVKRFTVRVRAFGWVDIVCEDTEEAVAQAAEDAISLGGIGVEIDSASFEVVAIDEVAE